MTKALGRKAARPLEVPFLGDVAKAPKKHRIKHPVDAILTLSLRENTLIFAFAALDAGILWGVNSAAVSLTTFTREVYDRGLLPITFVDNRWHDYDHKAHLDIVAQFKPKYATTRDYLTPEQAERAGVAYYTLDQILTWAEEVEQYAEHAIIIPKAPVLHEIPERHVIGYSVPTSYGGTPLPIEDFTGRSIHLLGGSWRDQRAIMDRMGDDIVSIDFNYIWKIAQKGHVMLPDGTTVNFGWDVLAPEGLSIPVNHLAMSMILSLGYISTALHQEYAPEAENGGEVRHGLSSKTFSARSTASIKDEEYDRDL